MPTARPRPQSRGPGRLVVGGVVLAAVAAALVVAATGLGDGPDALPSRTAAVATTATPEPAPTTVSSDGSSRTAPAGGWPPYSPLPTTVTVPGASASPSPSPTYGPDVAAGPKRRVATRVTVPDLGIDLPVMRQRASYPPCNVAMYLREFRQPGQGGPTYLYAHARRGMFLPLLTQSTRNNGRAMLGMRIYVYTGDNLRFEYTITRVRRHARDFRPVQAARNETVWLQTSEGPDASYPKLQVAGRLVGSEEVDHAEAHPRPRPVSC